jgi:hypothetical protein
MWLFTNTHPLYPPLEQVYTICPYEYLFKRGREYERGRSSLSPELPSLAINICGCLPKNLAGEEVRE